MNTKEKYRNALNDMMTRRSFRLNEICSTHRISVIAGTILLKLGWVNRVRGSRNKKWAGPAVMSESDLDAFIDLVRQYKRETRNGAKPAQPVTSEDRKQRQRIDLVMKNQRRSISLLWGLIRINY